MTRHPKVHVPVCGIPSFGMYGEGSVNYVQGDLVSGKLAGCHSGHRWSRPNCVVLVKRDKMSYFITCRPLDIIQPGHRV